MVDVISNNFVYYVIAEERGEVLVTI